MLLGVPRLEGYLDDVFCDAFDPVGFTPPLQLTKTPPYHRGLENDGCSRLLFHFSLVLNLHRGNGNSSNLEHPEKLMVGHSKKIESPSITIKHRINHAAANHQTTKKKKLYFV